MVDLILNKWVDDMGWCPSQCYYLTMKNEIPYVLYLRWRHNDPWTGYFIKNADSKEAMVENEHKIWSPEILKSKNFYFEDYETERAKEKIIELFNENDYFTIQENVCNISKLIFDLQKTKNEGRGISCVRDICFYLNQGEVEKAILVYENDGDKICGVYPDVDKLICQSLKIKPRYNNPKWS